MRGIASLIFLPLLLTATLAPCLPGVAQDASSPSTPSVPPASDAPTPAAQAPTETKPPIPPPGGRVVLHVNRNLSVMGHVELEDENVIVVRNLHGELESFPKSRVLQIVRLVDPKPGQKGLVVLHDGGIREGVIVEDTFEHVLIEIEGIRAKLKRDVVSHVVLEPTVEQRYAQAKAALQPGMAAAHLALCQWLLDQKQYELAKRELTELLSYSDMVQAKRLLTLVEAQLALNQRPKRSETESTNETPKTDEQEAPKRSSGPVYPADMMPKELLTPEDVNLIRVYEIDFEHPPRVTITPDTVRELIEKYGTNSLIPASQTGRTAMFRAAADQPLEIVRLMFELRARDLYPQIQVNSEPYALNLFRQRVHDTWLMNNCATTRCHGNIGAGRFFLHRKNYKDEEVRYTNLLILERLKLDPEWPLINYDDPERSLIIQYALPREVARKPHPDVPGWKPALRMANRKLIEDAFEWIRSMMQPRPEYPVDYQPPVLGDPQADDSGLNADRPDR